MGRFIQGQHPLPVAEKSLTRPGFPGLFLSDLEASDLTLHFELTFMKN